MVFVFYPSSLPEQAEAVFETLRLLFNRTVDRLLLSAGGAFDMFCLFLSISPSGAVRLGGRDALPD